jgi:cytochrome c biogenesis factor
MHHATSSARSWRLPAARAIAAAGLLAVLAGPAFAQWKWRDANGQITASDRAPPKEIPDKDILERPTNVAARRPAAPASAADAAVPLAAASAPARTALESEVEARKRAAEQQAAAKARAEEQRLAEQRAENCRRARNQVAALESGQRIARFNDKGEREVLDDKGRADELRVARDVIASDCR